jgi:hypothetical protein
MVKTEEVFDENNARTYLDFFHRVASDRVSQIFFCILKPTVEGRGLLGES